MAWMIIMSLRKNYVELFNICERVQHFSRSVPDLSKQAIHQRWTQRTERYMKKTIGVLSGGGDSKKKRKWNNYTYIQPPPGVIDDVSSSSRPQNTGNERRSRQLSAVLNDYITSLISSGEVCPQLVELGFEIIKVKITTDMKLINVTWAATGTNKDDEISALLPQCSSQLRSALIDLRIMGFLPPIHFVKDFSLSRLNQIEQLLKVADMGTDFEPSSLAEELKSEPVVGQRNGREATADSEVSWDRDVEYIVGPGGTVELRSKTTQNIDGKLQESLESWTQWNTTDDVIAQNGEQEVVDSDYKQDGVAAAGNETNVDRKARDATDSNSDVNKSTCVCELISASDAVNDASCGRVAANIIVDNVEKSFSRHHHQQNCSDSSDVTDAAKPTVIHRSNIYGLNHSDLWQQVAHTKRRSQDRSYGHVDSEVSKPGAAVKFTSGQVTGLLAKNRKQIKKKERLFRNIDSVLSSHYHEQQD